MKTYTYTGKKINHAKDRVLLLTNCVTCIIIVL